MIIMHRRAPRGKAQTATSAHPTTHQPAACPATALHVSAPRGERVYGAGLCELLALREGRDR